MTQTQWAGSFKGGGSDKVWAIAQIGATVYTKWGRRGLGLQAGEKLFASEALATAHFQKKVGEKQKEGYLPIAFGDPEYAVTAWFESESGIVPDATASDTAAAVTTISSRAVNPRFLANRLKPMSFAEIEQCLKGGWGSVTEKVNGNRCILHYDGETLTAYNRRGQMQSGLPTGAIGLVELAQPFVIDGEWIPTGYVMFDLLELGSVNYRERPYVSRISRLEEELMREKLIQNPSPAYDPFGSALQLLVPGNAEWLPKILERSGVEGVVVRSPTALFVGSDLPTPTVVKFKLQAEIDAFVIGVNPGTATGSIQLGLVRPSDGQILHICNVRSSLTDSAIAKLADALERGERPVLTVEYLLARTVGLLLVEPKTSIQKLRTDKVWQDCTTDQYDGKVDLVAAAPYFVTPNGYGN